MQSSRLEAGGCHAHGRTDEMDRNYANVLLPCFERQALGYVSYLGSCCGHCDCMLCCGLEKKGTERKNWR